jgi:hypothetical protein
MSMSARYYRRHAADCLKLSTILGDPHAQAFLRRMALAWTDLAEQAERNQQNDVVYEPAFKQPPKPDEKR